MCYSMLVGNKYYPLCLSLGSKEIAGTMWGWGIVCTLSGDRRKPKYLVK